MLLPKSVCALSNAPRDQGEPQNGSAWGLVYNPAFALGPGLAPVIDTPWMAMSVWGSSEHRSLAGADDLDGDSGAPSFDTSGYDPMWDDMKFGEIAAYGGLGRDALRVAGMRAIDGSDGASGAIPYGRLTLQRDVLGGQDQLALGAYGTQASVRQVAISGFGDDSYTDVAVDGSWRWTPGGGVSDVITTHVMVLREGENLMASHAIFGTRKTDDFTMFRSDARWSWGANIAPALQYFRITGSSDPARLGTPFGSPDSNGFIAGIDYLPSDDARSPLNWFHARLSLQFVAYSEFDGSSRDAAHNNTVLLHLTINAG